MAARDTPDYNPTVLGAATAAWFKDFQTDPDVWGSAYPVAGTTNYFQRVYDDGTGGYCYYTKTTIDPTPSAGETTPNYTGTISDHSVVKVITTT